VHLLAFNLSVVTGTMVKHPRPKRRPRGKGMAPTPRFMHARQLHLQQEKRRREQALDQTEDTKPVVPIQQSLPGTSDDMAWPTLPAPAPAVTRQPIERTQAKKAGVRQDDTTPSGNIDRSSSNCLSSESAVGSCGRKLAEGAGHALDNGGKCSTLCMKAR